MTRTGHVLAASSLVEADDRIPLVRLDNANSELLGELVAAVARVAATGAFTLGEEVEAFEREFADYCGARAAVGVSSGTEALVLGLRALGVGAGDEVIVPANSFIATAEAVTLVGAQPRFVDVDPNSHLMTAETVAPAIGSRTRAVIAVHLFGATVDLDPIVELCAAHGIAVVEDACQAHGAFYRARRAGTIGDLGCFSFYPTKNLGGWGDGGAVVTNRPDIADRIALLRSHGERPRYRHRLPGTTARLDAIQAAVLRRKLHRLDGWNSERRRLGLALRSSLSASDVGLPPIPPEYSDHVYHVFVVRSEERDELRAQLAADGIATAVHYPDPIHKTEAYREDAGPLALPVSEALARTSCTLPLWPGMSPDQLERIAEGVRRFSASVTTL